MNPSKCKEKYIDLLIAMQKAYADYSLKLGLQNLIKRIKGYRDRPCL